VTSLKDGRGALGMTTTITTTTGPMGGRENTDNFTGYVNKDDDDDPIGRRGGVVAPKRQCGRRMEKKEEEEDVDKGMASGDDDSGEGKDGKGGTEYDPFFRPLMAWDNGGTMAASTAAHNNQIVNGGGGRGIGNGAQQSQNSESEREGERWRRIKRS
jgi:hypothetical protein